ncbi:beta strand repeat-containing protein, partial [Campylobacter concisus]|uniref:beta strand repeat-containing protein n=2 Tax=Campylobacter concisus TaxID=199 RepID=UPI00165F34B9
LNALEETAAGGPQAGGNGGDGVSLSSTSFAEGGHISNINANVGSIDALSLAAGGDNSFGVSGGSAIGAGAGAEATGPALPAGSIKIPLSAYLNENINDGFVFHMRSLVHDMSYAGSTLNGYSIVRWIDGRDYLVPNAGVNTFTFQDGWFKSNDGKLAIGQDNAKDLVLTSSANSANHTGDVAKIVNPSSDLSVFGGDNGSKITSDGANIDTKIYSSVKGDEINITSDVTGTGTYEIDPFTHEYIGGQSYISTGSSSDNLNIAPGVTLTNTIINMGAGSETVNLKGTATDKINFKGSILMTGADNDVINIENASFDVTDERASVIDGGSGNDTINVNSGAELKQGTRIRGGSGNDTINVNSGANIHGTRSEGAIIHMGKSASPLDKGEQGNTSELNVKNGAFMSNAKIEVVAKENTINFEKGATTTGVNIIAEDAGTKSTINIKTDLKKSVEGRRSSISTGAGDDIVNVSDKAELTRVEMKLGEGLNKVTINDATMKGGSIENGNGGNEITLTNNTVFNEAYISTGDGKDIININNGSKFGGLGSGISTNAGKDEININNSTVEGVDEYDTVEVNTGDDVDMITIKDSNIKYTDINTGNGDDVIQVFDGSSLNSTKIETGEGNDIVTFEHHSENYDSDPTQPYSKPIATKTEINTGNGRDTVLLSGLGNSGNYANRVVSDFDDVKINMGDGDHKHVQIHKAKVEKTTITTGSKDDLVQIQSDSLMEGENNIYTGAGKDDVEIRDSKLNGTASAKTAINTGEDKDHVVINNSTLTHAVVDADKGDDDVDIEEGTTFNYSTINTSEGNDTITINRDPSDARITFQSSALNTGDGNDTVEVTNTTFLKLAGGNPSAIDTGNGDDTITINGGTIFQDFSYIAAGNGVDTITLESGAKFNQANVYADAGDDIINVNGAEFKGENAYNHNAGVHGGAGNDTIFVNSGKFDNAKVEGDAGNDTIHIKSGARFENASIYGDSIDGLTTGNDTIIVEKGATLINTTIDGGAGFDTLKVADNSIDFSHVKNIEKLDMTNGEKTTLTLTASNVQDILRDSSENKLKIDGDSNDELTLGSSWTKGASSGGYTTYTSGT